MRSAMQNLSDKWKETINAKYLHFQETKLYVSDKHFSFEKKFNLDNPNT